MLRLAIRNLFQSKIRLAMSVGGVALALSLMLALDAIFAGAEQQLTAYIDNSEADVFVAQKGVRNLHMVSSWLPATVVRQVQEVEGVEGVTPILYVTGMVDTGKERNLVYLIGLPPDPQAGKPWRLVEGVAVPAPGEIVLDRRVAERSSLKIRDQVKVLGRSLRIAGLSEGTANITNSVAFVAVDDFERMRGSAGSAGSAGSVGSAPELGGVKVVSFVLAKVEQGASPGEVAARIELQVSGVTAQTRQAFADRERGLVKDMAADILTIMNSVGFVIGLAVTALTVYTATLSRLAEYGVLKAVGARNRQLYLAVAVQAVASVAFGFLVGIAFTLALSVVTSSLPAGVALLVSAESLLRVGLSALAIAGLAAILPVRQVAGLDPAVVFRRKI